MHHWTRNFFVALMAASVLLFGISDAFAVNRVVLGNDIQIPLAASADAHTVSTLATLRSRAAQSGKIRVIVGVRAAFAPEGNMSIASVVQQRNEIARMQSAVHGKIPSLKATPGKAREFSTIPFMALEVDAAELEALAGQIEITSIEEDRLAVPTLAESVPLIGGTAAWSSGYTGAGQTIAILDSGVDNTHPFLAGKVVSEACYSTNSAGSGASSLCPGGVTQSTAAGSGANCDLAIYGCDHGTHVAGIAAGKGASFSGVAKDASLIAINVFTRINSVATCSASSPCLAAYISDINLGLERVYLLRNNYSIAAVNMSLGGSSYSSQASCDAANSSTKTAIDNLRSVNIATVIASGNEGSSSSISEPGCISTAISVGATTKTDVVDWYSNSASFLNLLAPGSAINSSVPGGGYAFWDGTSMATPHVVGAWALLKQQNPNITVTDALNLLSVTGTPITDARNGIVKPRIRVDAALNYSSNTPPALTYTAETGYGADGVDPNFGTASTLFFYRVVYTDASNIAPSSIRACIDGACYAMSKDMVGPANAALRDNSYTNGEQYVYVTALAAGAHSYYFDASRGAITVTLPAFGALSGPSVSNLTISTSTLPNGNVGTAYSATLTASGGAPPYSWNAPGLPAGLSINSATGAISGTPTLTGIYGLTVTVSDAAGASISKALSIVIPDNVPPGTPTGLVASAVSTTQINLSWMASTDNVGVTAYKVYRNSVQVGIPAGISFSDAGLTASTTYSYTVAACDAAGNCSAQSAATTATTMAILFVETGIIDAPTNATELIYSPAYNSLLLKNSASAIATIDLGSNASTTHFSNWNFTDMSMAPGGRYVFAADYGGENIGYGTPANQHYVHRLDLATATWETKTAYIAGNIQAVSDSQFILKSKDQWVTFTNNSWGTGSAVVILNAASSTYFGPGYDAGVYYGDFRYVPATGRLLHGNSGSSSQEIQAFNIVSNNFNKMERSGTYGSAQGYGPNVTLATDGSAFYYGRLQVDPLDVSHNLRVFPEAIYAATKDVAFGNGKFYDAHTGVLLGTLGFNTTVYGLNPYGNDFWAYDQSQNKLRHFSPTTPDITPPAVPTGLRASVISSTQVNLSWTASTDNVGVSEYKVYRDTVQVGASAITSFTDTGLTAATTYRYTVAACDVAGNCSAQSSPPVSATTLHPMPTVFSFTAQTGAALSSWATSNTVTISGLPAATTTNISIVGGEYSIDGGAFTAADGTVANGQTVTVRVMTSSAYSATTSAALTVGAFSANFDVTTLDDTVPDAFSFAPKINAAPHSVVTSNAIIVTGITAPSPISVSGGQYSINGGAYTSAAGTVNNGDAVTVQLTAATSGSIQAMLTIGGVSGAFNVKTRAMGSDFNGDGKADVLWRNGTTGQTVVWLMNGAAIATSALLGTVPTAWQIAAVNDLDGDGKADILWRNGATGQTAAWLMNDAAIATGALLGTVPTAWQIAAVNDLDGDGKADVLWRNGATGETTVWLMNGAAIATGALLGTVPTAWQIAAVNDLDGDGKADVLWRNGATGETTVWLMNGAAAPTTTALGTVPTAWQIAAANDFNGDGKADILWRNGTTGENAVSLMNGASALLFTAPIAWQVAAVNDLDGDGKADVLWRDGTTGETTLWLMNGAFVPFTVLLGTVPAAWQAAVVKDFNLDGKADVLWRDGATGKTAVWLMNGAVAPTTALLGTVPVAWGVVSR